MKKIKRSFALWCYYQLMRRADRHVERRLRSRLLMGKEDPERLEERLGISLAERPTGNLIWFHAASVGESLSLVELIKRISSSQPDYNFLITTGTITSAKLILSRLPSNAVHQYIPVDTPKAVEKFLDRWRPSLAIWTESEFWPNLISFTSARDIPMILINARISEKSYRRWRFFKKSLKNLIEKFNYSLIQDEKTVKYFSKIGISSNNFELTGTLKEGSAALPYSETEQVEISKQILNRPVWLAASTHEGEEKLIAAAHRHASKASQGLLLIIVPRHPERGLEIASILTKENFKICLRSKKDKISSDTQIYIADTLGELGLWYRVAPVSFVGGSFVPIGGHNPFEPAALGSAILHGPYVENFKEIYNRLNVAGAAVKIEEASELGVKLIETLSPENAAKLAQSAWEVSSNGAEITDRAIKLIYENLSLGDL
ncbi:MAG: 3-deoxy-D-manno-octulosonic acid transferase [Paracoccaceae bacterium]|nr:3-deoxy-D-manno-octulosonic acid transferase [Paracoccaceae bacterium]